MNKSKIKEVGEKVIKLESNALSKLSKSLDKNFIIAVELISKLNGKIIISGVGKDILLIIFLGMVKMKKTF